MLRREWRLWSLLAVVLSVGLAGVALFAAGGASGATAGGSRARAASQTFRVSVDGMNPSANEAFIAISRMLCGYTQATPSPSRWKATASRTR